MRDNSRGLALTKTARARKRGRVGEVLSLGMCMALDQWKGVFYGVWNGSHEYSWVVGEAAA